LDMGRKRAALVTAICSILLFTLAFHDRLAGALDELVLECARLGWGAPLIVAALVAVLQLFMLPTFPFMVGAGAIFPQIFGQEFGQVVAVLSVFIGLWAGSMCAFRVGRACCRDWIEHELSQHPRMRALNAMVEDQGWWVVFLARSSPLMPSELFNYMCALTSLRERSYAIGCLGSLVPITVWVTCSASAVRVAKTDGGDQVQQVKDKKNNLKESLAFVLINLAFLALLSLILLKVSSKYMVQTPAQELDEEVASAGAAPLSMPPRDAPKRKWTVRDAPPGDADRSPLCGGGARGGGDSLS